VKPGVPPDTLRVPMSTIWKDPVVVAAFVDARSARVPESETQIAVLLRLVGRLAAPPSRVLDVGTGDGFLLGVLLEAFPASVGVGVDHSPAMVARARERLAALGPRAEVREGDLETPAWRAGFDGGFDAVVSGFAIHHLPDARKREVYGEIRDLLAPGGMFVNLEHVASATPEVEAIWDDALVAHQYAARRAAGERIDVDRVRAEYQTRPDRLANILAPVDVQCGWLRELGFADVDCYWKFFELAIFGGFRPRR
jgi:tRNA (cmo5U34)-methyltransferase